MPARYCSAILSDDSTAVARCREQDMFQTRARFPVSRVASLIVVGLENPGGHVANFTKLLAESGIESEVACGHAIAPHTGEAIYITAALDVEERQPYPFEDWSGSTRPHLREGVAKRFAPVGSQRD